MYEYLNKLEYKSCDDLLNENNAKNITMGNHYQGIINLIDNNDKDGGFHCILKGHNIIKKWYDEAKNHLKDQIPNGRYIFRSDFSIDMKYFNCETAKISSPAGTLIIFDATLPHGTKPNFSQNSRIIQFLRYVPSNIFNENTLKRRNNLLSKKIYPQCNFICPI